MRSFVVGFMCALVLVLVLMLASGCGGASKGGATVASVSAASTRGPAVVGATTVTRGLEGDRDDDEIGVRKQTKAALDRDLDDDNDVADRAREGYYDSDDGPVRSYGRAATAAERSALVALVDRYYQAVAAGDGRAGCAMTLPSLAAALPEDFGSSFGPAYTRGAKTCAAVLHLMFQHFQSGLRGVYAITATRVAGDRAYVLLGSKTMPASYVIAQRIDGRWLVAGLLNRTLP